MFKGTEGHGVEWERLLCFIPLGGILGEGVEDVPLQGDGRDVSIMLCVGRMGEDIGVVASESGHLVVSDLC